MNYAGLVPVLVKAIQEQQDQLAKQQSEIEALKRLVCQDVPTPIFSKRPDRQGDPAEYLHQM